MSVPYHGWTHRPKAQGGTDPIPGVAAAPSFWPVAHYFAGVALLAEMAESTWTLIMDADAPGGCYVQNGGTNGPDVDYLAFPLMLNSPVDFGQWRFRWSVAKGPDAPTYRVEIANALVDGVLLVPGEGDPPVEAGTGTCLTWNKLYPSTTTPDEVDLYAAAESWGGDITGFDAFCPEEYMRLTGAAGDVGDTMDYTDGTSSYIAWNGGPGFCWLRFHVIDKNASSSTYNLKVAQLAVSHSPQALDNSDVPDRCA